MGFEYRKFKDIALDDVFFDSLKADYSEFSEWFQKKSENTALIHFNKSGILNGFLYLKIEDEPLDIEPPQKKNLRVKVGTMKIDAHGTRLGERFIKKIFDFALSQNTNEIYVTIFEKHSALIDLFERYNFSKIGEKKSHNGVENVYSRVMKGNNVIPQYPFISFNDNNIYFLSIYPEYHSRLFPDSILKTENTSIVEDVSYTNSIHKIYIAGMQGMNNLKVGDILIIYRTAEKGTFAKYSAVFSSICVVEELKNIYDFSDYDDFYKYCMRYSIFSEDELKVIYKEKKYKYVIKMTYNLALKKRVIRAKLLEMGIMSNDRNFYNGFGKLNLDQLINVLRESETDESIVINKTWVCK